MPRQPTPQVCNKCKKVDRENYRFRGKWWCRECGLNDTGVVEMPAMLKRRSMIDYAREMM